MSFNAYKTIEDVLKEFNITYSEDDYLSPRPFLLSDYLLSELDFSLKEVVIENSKYAACETFIYPILREIWKTYKEYFMLWSHHSLNYDEKLSGIPDYILAKRSPLGKVVFEKPFFVVVEAKRENFTEGWGQCLAELVAMQKINAQTGQTLFGIVSTGIRWEFGKLKETKFTKNLKGYSIENLELLFAAINFVFEECKAQILAEL